MDRSPNTDWKRCNGQCGPRPGGWWATDDLITKASRARALESADGTHKPDAGPVLLRISDVEREDVKWRWSHRLPLGKLTVVSGDPGEGKSWMTMALATPISLGQPLPGDNNSYPRANVLLLNAEDGTADTIRPRLEDMGADLTRIIQFSHVRDEGGEQRWIDLSKDIFHLESILASGSYQLVIIDPINAYLGGIDAHKDTAIRSVLGPLAALAERHNVAILVLRHLTKNAASKTIYRGMGGIGYTAAARVEWLVGRNPDKPEERIIAIVKNNLAPPAKSVAFELRDGQFFWIGDSEVSADQLLAVHDEEGRDALAEASAFLQQALADGERPSKEVEAEAKSQGIAAMTLKRARWSVGVAVRREGFGANGKWLWSLRGSSSAEGPDSPKGFKQAKSERPSPDSDSLRPPKGFNPGSQFEPLRESEPLTTAHRGSAVQGRSVEPLCVVCGKPTELADICAACEADVLA